MSTCLHNAVFPCPWCRAQRSYWGGGELPVEKRMISVTIGGQGIALTEGVPGEGHEGATLRPAALILAEEIAKLDLKGKRVVEVGAGVGLPGIIAAIGGADVTFVETDRAIAARLGDDLKARGIQATVCSSRLESLRQPFDVICGSEILYDVALIREIFNYSFRWWTGDGPLLFADPARRRQMIEKEAPLRGLLLHRREASGTLADGSIFMCDIWEGPAKPQGRDLDYIAQKHFHHNPEASRRLHNALQAVIQSDELEEARKRDEAKAAKAAAKQSAMQAVADDLAERGEVLAPPAEPPSPAPAPEDEPCPTTTDPSTV